jgi:hypothetical protein
LQKGSNPKLFCVFVKLSIHGSCSLDLTKKKGWYIYIGEKMGFDKVKFSYSNANMCHCIPSSVAWLGLNLFLFLLIL